MSPVHSTIVLQIADLQEERALLWALPWRSPEVRARLGEIAGALDALWHARRRERARIARAPRAGRAVYRRRI